MTHKVVAHTTSAAVAALGTFTVAYPTGTNAGHFRGAVGHYLKTTPGGDRYTSPANFTLTFGTSSITVTSVDMILAAGVDLFLQLEMVGNNDGLRQDVRALPNIVHADIFRINLGAPDVADADGISESQTVTFATTPLALINGALSDGELATSVATFDVPRNVVAAWTSTAVLTVTGTDVNGDVIVEASASGTSMTGKKAFKTITEVSFSANVSAATVGSGDVLGLPVFLPERGSVIAEYEDGVRLPVDTSPVRIYWQVDQTDLLAGTSLYLISPVAGVIKSATTIAWKAVTTGGNVTFKVDTVTVDGLTVVVASGGGVGDLDTDTPTLDHASTIVAANSKIEVLFDAAFATAGALTGWIEIIPTAPQHGTVVAGVDTEPTATTGDVRGTYDPYDACDGSKAFELLVSLPDATYQGRTNFAG